MSDKKTTTPTNAPTNTNDTQNAQPQEERIAINGFNQVLEMLRIADPAFRESLLRRLAAKDRNLARSLRNDLEQG
jgi:hypothetical protein